MPDSEGKAEVPVGITHHHFHTTGQPCSMTVGLHKGVGNRKWILGGPSWRLVATLGMGFVAEGEEEGTDRPFLILNWSASQGEFQVSSGGNGGRNHLAVCGFSSYYISV